MNNIPLNHDTLERALKESLESEVIELIAKRKEIDIRNAMDIYYKSQLADQIDRGEYGIQYLDKNYLVSDLIENEPEVFDADESA
jgi:hypothetical protein